MSTRVLMLTQWFDPEPTFKGLAFARALVKKGFEVEVVTGFPNYPEGKLYAGYKMRFIQKEWIDGVKITRVPLYPSHNHSALKRILNYITFGFSSLVYSLFFAKRPDVVYVYHPPLTTGLSALILRFFRKVPVVYDIQDMWPDSLAATGMLKNKGLLRFIERLCNLVYKFVDKIVVLSPGFKQLLIDRGVSAEKIQLIYNWCDEAALLEASIESLNEIIAPSKFTVMFAGNMGYAQALDAVIDAAEKISPLRKDICFILLGSGVLVDQIKQTVLYKQLDNVKFISQVPMSQVGSYLEQADVLMVHLKDDPLFKITIPSKTQAYMAIGKPILMAVHGDAAHLVETIGCGITAIPENSDSIMDSVIQLADMDKTDRDTMSENGRKFYFDTLSLECGVESFSKLFMAVAQLNS